MQQRILTLPGAVNLRDFGGYATQDGRQIRTGKLYHSGALAHLTAAGCAAFAGLDVQLICDLRRDDEKRDEPTVLPADKP